MPDKARDKKRRESRDAKQESAFKVADRRHWATENAETLDETGETEVEPARPTLLDQYRLRAEEAERKLQEYIDAFKTFKGEQEEFRLRLNRDVERKVELMFGELVGELLETADHLDLALDHARTVPEAESLAAGVTIARDHFLATLERHGVECVSPIHETFDPNVSEAMRVDPVDSRDEDGRITEVLRPGYKLGDRVIRAAKVAVGKHTATES